MNATPDKSIPPLGSTTTGVLSAADSSAFKVRLQHLLTAEKAWIYRATNALEKGNLSGARAAVKQAKIAVKAFDKEWIQNDLIRRSAWLGVRSDSEKANKLEPKTHEIPASNDAGRKQMGRARRANSKVPR